jgi:hypothetical protein
MSTQKPSRPWYCRDDVVDEYRSTLTEDGDTLPMLKALKILRAIVVNLGIIGIGTYAIHRGGDPTILAFTALTVLGAYNGLELSDYLALVQAYQEVQAASDQSDSTDSSE